LYNQAAANVLADLQPDTRLRIERGLANLQLHQGPQHKLVAESLGLTETAVKTGWHRFLAAVERQVRELLAQEAATAEVLEEEALFVARYLGLDEQNLEEDRDSA
jgi:hypothetical protein